MQQVSATRLTYSLSLSKSCSSSGPSPTIQPESGETAVGGASFSKDGLHFLSDVLLERGSAVIVRRIGRSGRIVRRRVATRASSNANLPSVMRRRFGRGGIGGRDTWIAGPWTNNKQSVHRVASRRSLERNYLRSSAAHSAVRGWKLGRFDISGPHVVWE